ncbi:hypothetical protein BEN30_13265 [Magnetovibrio blakemorei]|uniref:Transposase DDE domain-containing protein n=1 Tax=Magnetovibrio blakemorei TaxID=28181 RepID=A0A1E5Q625_9PROT|nr:hypothetical protein BEN30_13265 [Magnetovibrio blakemorei]
MQTMAFVWFARGAVGLLQHLQMKALALLAKALEHRTLIRPGQAPQWAFLNFFVTWRRTSDYWRNARGFRRLRLGKGNWQGAGKNAIISIVQRAVLGL